MSKNMKALVYTANEEMTYRNELVPEIQEGEALVKVSLAGICGSDMHAYLGHDERRVPPLILGHEVVGVVVKGKNIGQRVVINPLVTCDICVNCLSGKHNLCHKRDIIGMYKPGAFAQFITISEKNLVPIPDDMSFEKAVLSEPGATALHAVLLSENNISRPISELKVLVIGAGSVGLLTALILLDKGSKVDLHEINSLRIKTVKQYTKCNVLDPSSNTINDNSYDLVFDAVGNMYTRDASIKYAKSGATVVHIGLADSKGDLDIRKITLQEISFIGCYTYTKSDFIAIINKLNNGSLGNLDWIDKKPLFDGNKMFAKILKGECAAPKVVLEV